MTSSGRGSITARRCGRVHDGAAGARAARPRTWSVALRGLAMLAALGLAARAMAATAIQGGTVVGVDTTWTLAGSPYVLNGAVTVAPGATLTIEPGVTVSSSGYQSGLVVDGTLIAVGTAAAPISFTSASASPGSWGGIVIEGTSAAPNVGSRLEYVGIEYAGYGGNALQLTYAHASVAHATIQGCSYDGVRGNAGGVADLADVTFSGNAGFAAYFTDGSVAPNLSALRASGNGTDAVGFGGGTTSGTRTFQNAGLPYHLYGALAVPAGSTVVVEPGVTLRSEGYQSGLVVDGTLTAIGTVDAPIVFAGTTARPGTWGGIVIEGTSAAPNVGSRLEHVTISDAGYGGNALQLTYARASVAHATIQGSSYDAVRGNAGGVADLTDVTFSGNAGFAAYFSDGSVAPQLSALTASGNGTDAIRFDGGTTSGTRVFENAGLPYHLYGRLVVPAGSTVSFEPGVTLRSEGYQSGLVVDGTLTAIGTADAPIVFTGTSASPGTWGGIVIEGASGAINAGSQLEHATLEYGGYGRSGNLTLLHATARLSGCTIRNAGTSGIWASDAGRTVVEESAILDNADWAVYHETAGAEPVYATNDWWGAPGGPSASDLCNPAGGGGRVSTAVVYQPFLTTSSTYLGPVPPIGTLNLTVTPQRWFTPADGSTKAWVKLTLRDEVGRPVQGRTVSLATSLGAATAGGLTDANGETLAYVVSGSAGDADLAPSLAVGSQCEPYRSTTSRITFTAADPNPLMPDAQAPYFADRMDISPMPVVQGGTETVRARLQNPNPFAVIVDAEFGYAQLGVGLAFGPIGRITGQVIPANSEGAFQISWVPPLSGHYCLQMQYSAMPVATGAPIARAPGSQPLTGTAQINADVQRGCMRSARQEDAIDKAGKAIDWVVRGINTFGTITGTKFAFKYPMKVLVYTIKADLDMARKIADAMVGLGDADGCGDGDSGGGGGSGGSGGGTGSYKRFTAPRDVFFQPVEPDDLTSQRRADAFNHWLRTSLDTIENFRAMHDAEQRAADASAAGDLAWASQQTAAWELYRQRAGTGFLALADANDALLQVLRDEGVTDDLVTRAAVDAWLATLRAQGFSQEELDTFRLVGFSDAEIEEIRQALLATDPDAFVGDHLAWLAALSAPWRELGEALAEPGLLHTTALPSALGPTPRATSTDPGRLARPTASRSTLVVGNPLPSAALVELQARRVDLPPDWTVRLTPSSVTLDPGAQATVAVELLPGSSVPQGTRPRVAVEAYAQGQLLGGVVVDTLVPRYVSVSSDCVGAGTAAEGAACACSLDCGAGLMCAPTSAGAATGTCLASCDLAAPSCPHAGQTCESWSGPDGVCSPANGVAPASTSTPKGCGCSGAGGGAPAALLGLLALLLARRRRTVR